MKKKTRVNNNAWFLFCKTRQMSAKLFFDLISERNKEEKEVRGRWMGKWWIRYMYRVFIKYCGFFSKILKYIPSGLWPLSVFQHCVHRPLNAYQSHKLQKVQGVH